MPIIFAKSFQASDGECYATLKEAQVVELAIIFDRGGSENSAIASKYAEIVVEAKEEIMDVLSTTENSKPLARKINGGTKKRSPKIKAVPEPDKCQTLPGV